MRPDHIIAQLIHQAAAIRALVHGVPDEQARWKPSPDDWSILEVVHHLYDEEVEDFRAHLDHILYHGDQPWPRIDPGGWVTQRCYNQQDPAEMLAKFLAERETSLAWLRSLVTPDWNASFAMPWGALTAGDMLPRGQRTTCCTCASWWNCITPGRRCPLRRTALSMRVNGKTFLLFTVAIPTALAAPIVYAVAQEETGFLRRNPVSELPTLG